jgi:hypothetical protein
LWIKREDLEVAFNEYFKYLFTAISHLEVDRSLAALENKGMPQMNEKLLPELNVEEISQALNQIAPLKAPGPDGFPAFFFQQNWPSIKEEVSSTIIHFFNSGSLDASLIRLILL